MGDPANRAIRFDDFEIDRERRRLLRGGETVPLKSRAFDILAALVENRGELLTKDRLLEMVWEGQFVEENNLTVHVAALRKALGEKKGEHRYIVTVPGKGYRFIGQIEPASGDLVVERHSVQRIVIEESVEDDAAAAPLQLMPAPRRPWRSAGLALATVGLLVFVGSAAWYYGNRAARTASPPKYVTRNFATPGGIPQRVAISRDGRSIAFALRQNGLDSLWVGDLDSGDSIRITQPSTRLHTYLAFDHDKRFVYFTARDDEHPRWTLMRVPVFGGPVQELTVGVNSSLAFSPDGKQIAFVRQDAAEPEGSSLVVINAETGKDEHVLLRPKQPAGFSGHGVSWSPDGRRIAVGLKNDEGKDCRITAVDTADSSTQVLSDTPCNPGTNFAWTADGQGLYFLEGGEENPRRRISLLPLNGSGERELTGGDLSYNAYDLSVSKAGSLAVLSVRTDPEIRMSDSLDAAVSRLIAGGTRVSREAANGLAFAPDGAIIFAALKDGGRVLWETGTAGEARQLTPSLAGAEDGQVSVTPDNRYLVFQSERSGGLQIWRADRDGSSMVQLTSGEGENSQPALTPDGQFVIYSSKVKGLSSLWRVPAAGGKPEPVPEARGTWPDVSPDGRSIAYTIGEPHGSQKKEIAVIPIAGGVRLHTFPMPVNGIYYNRLRWSPDGTSIIYKDTVSGLWRQPLSGEAPERLSGFENFRVFHFAFSPDGRMAYSGGVQMREIIIAEPPR